MQLTDLQTNILQEAEAFITDYYRNECSGHDVHHSLRVARTARALAEKEGADPFAATLAALLHDVDDRKLSPKTWQSKSIARGFMERQGIGPELQALVVDIISTMSFSGTGASVPASPEGRCVQDADRLDAIGAIGIGRAFAYGGSHNRAMYDPADKPQRYADADAYYSTNSTTINHFYEKLLKLEHLMNTDTARQIARQRTAFMEDFLRQFYAEWDYTPE